jgi:hypothetical protein
VDEIWPRREVKTSDWQYKAEVVLISVEMILKTSVANPDPGSGALLTPGSGFRDG